MKQYSYKNCDSRSANALLNGQRIQVFECRAIVPTMPAVVHAESLGKAIELLGATAITAVKPQRTLTKRELVDRLIAIGKATEFNALLGTLPLAEKLRWEASPTIAPDYPYLVENRTDILAALSISGEQFDSIFQ